MSRSRTKRHVQQEMAFRTHGGKRVGAGRPPKGKRSSERHERRPKHDARHPIHITIRVAQDIAGLRKRDMYIAIREATAVTVKREDFRIVHFTIQGNHIHLIVEAMSRLAIARGMQGFQISAAKHINRVMTERTGTRRTGHVFPDRYHPRALTTPREVRHAIAYVLNNWRRHGEDRASFTRSWKVDPYSNAVDFPGWKELSDSPFLFRPPAAYKGLVTWLPKTWLLRESWKKHAPISVHETPGPQR
jgi:REP element-mobilizing transposase RayT